MKNNIFFRFSRKISPYILIAMMIVSFQFFGAQCNTFVNGDDISLKELLFTWSLQRQTGINIDVCQNEQITFHNDFSVVSICPPQDSAFRNFTIDKNSKIITYTQSGVSYNYEILNSNNITNLNLYGINVNRNLFYIKVSTKLDDYKKTQVNNQAIHSTE